MLHVPCMFGLRFFGTWFNPFTQGASVSRSREGRWGVRHGNLKSWVLQCYSATSIWCVLYIMFIRVYHCLSWFDPTTTCTSRVNSPEMCLQKRRLFFSVAFNMCRCLRYKSSRSRSSSQRPAKLTQNQNLQTKKTEDCLNILNSSNCLKVLISKIAKDCSKSIEPW